MWYPAPARKYGNPSRRPNRATRGGPTFPRTRCWPRGPAREGVYGSKVEVAARRISPGWRDPNDIRGLPQPQGFRPRLALPRPVRAALPVQGRIRAPTTPRSAHTGAMSWRSSRRSYTPLDRGGRLNTPAVLGESGPGSDRSCPGRPIGTASPPSQVR